MSNLETIGAGGSAPARAVQQLSADRRLRQLKEAHEASLSRYLVRLGVASSELEDAIQEVFIVAAYKLPEIRPTTERAFLFGTAARIASNARRGRRRRNRLSTSLVDAPREPSPRADDLTDELMRRALLDDALERMPLDTHLVFLLVEVEEMPISTVAERLGLKEGTVASRLRRARACFGASSERVRATLANDRPSRPGLNGSVQATPTHFAPSSLSPKKPGVADARPRPSFDPEVLSWWAQRGEVDALGALLDVYGRSHPHRPSITRTTLEGSTRVRTELSSRMLHGKPPDTFQTNGGRPLLSWIRRTSGEGMDPLDFLFGSEGWGKVFPSDVLDLVSHRGRLYAVPLNIHRTNSLFFNTRVLADCGLLPPFELEELDEVAAVLRGHGIVPLAMGHKEPWALTMLAFETVLPGEAGADYYREFFSGRRSAHDPEIKSALAHVARLLNHANADATDLRWDGALDLVRSGRAAMSMMGDWAKGYLISKGCRPGVDFGQAPGPGGARAYVFATDVFGLPKRASHRADTIELLKVFGSKEGQAAFSELKGSIPARLDAAPSGYGSSASFAGASLVDFQCVPRVPTMASLVPDAFAAALDAAMEGFAESRDSAAVIAVIRAHYDLLRT
jgi:glucose/mannose transport system substrate-binding protein